MLERNFMMFSNTLIRNKVDVISELLILDISLMDIIIIKIKIRIKDSIIY
jgi:hypothetical protein